jgi:peroxiredoxin
MFKTRISWVLALALFVGGPAIAEEPKTKPAEAPKKEEPKKEAPKAETPKPATPATTPAAGTGAAIGKPAPDFMGKDYDGKDHKLADYKGKVVVLEWFNHECPFCQRHCKAGTAKNTLAKFKDKPVVWIGVNSNGTAEEKAADIKKYCKDNNITFPILQDAAGKIGKAYGAKTTPHVFVIDQKGNVAYMGAMDDDKEGKGAKTNYVEQAIDALLKGTTVATATTEPYGCPVKYK